MARPASKRRRERRSEDQTALDNLTGHRTVRSRSVKLRKAPLGLLDFGVLRLYKLPAPHPIISKEPPVFDFEIDFASPSSNSAERRVHTFGGCLQDRTLLVALIISISPSLAIWSDWFNYHFGSQASSTAAIRRRAEILQRTKASIDHPSI